MDFGPVSYRVIDRRQGKPAILIDSDPVHTQLRLVAGEPDFKPRLDAHKCLFTFGENIGTPRSQTPTAGYLWHPTRQPVAVEGWRNADPPGSTYTTVGLWFTPEWDLTVQGRKVQGSKRPDWLRCLDLPARTGAVFEIASRGFGGVPEDRGLLEAHGWRLRDALSVSSDPWRYRDYLIHSRGEFSVAKNTVVAMRSGWFSDRSACYLAAGRPVVLQDTGFGDVLPLGPGLHAFRNVEEAAGAIQEIEADYARASAHASEVAREYFAAEKVLGRLLSEAGL